jgi:hypothetical protein
VKGRFMISNCVMQSSDFCIRDQVISFRRTNEGLLGTFPSSIPSPYSFPKNTASTFEIYRPLVAFAVPRRTTYAPELRL